MKHHLSPHTSLVTVAQLLLCCLIAFVAAQSHAQYLVVHLERPYNTPGSETGAIRVGDTILAYSSMQPSTSSRKNKQFSFGGEQMNVYQARIARSGKMSRPRLSRWGINSKRHHTGNLALDPITNDLYFTRCDMDDPDLRCEIWWARKKKRGWEKAERLRGEVNLKGHTATQPTIGHDPDGNTLLYFSSDRPGGMGGLDLWYAILDNGSASSPTNLGPQVNSAYDEITPFYDQRNNVLYFSSDRPGGRGGHDIYSSAGHRNTWTAASPVCGCLNSEQNDIYFTITDHDSTLGFPSGGFLSSNRTDSYFLTDSMCCNDIYRWGIDSAMLATASTAADTTPVPPKPEPPQALAKKFMFPLFLYFHNDEPDPHSRDSATRANYADCQARYAALRNLYVSHQSSPADSALMQQFFDTCIEGNFKLTEALFDYIEEQLDAGHHVVLTVAGYASPIYTDSYNHRISQRRIESFINMIRAWRGGLFADAIDDGRLIIQRQAHGATKEAAPLPSDHRIYSLRSALARRIEIVSCQVM